MSTSENDEQGLIPLKDVLPNLALPNPIERNLVKAFGKLCTASLAVPIAVLEGKASEIRAKYDARVSLIQTTGQKIGEGVNPDTAYSELASQKYSEKIVGKQKNVDTVTALALQDIYQSQELKNNVASEQEISDDWLNRFDDLAASKSTEEMQGFFARILSGEIIRPGSFSLRTLAIADQLDQHTATLFATLSSIASRLYDPATKQLADARVISVSGSASSNSLQQFGLPFGSLNALNEAGLIISDYNSWIGYSPSILTTEKKAAVSFGLQSKRWVLIAKEPGHTQQYKANGVALTNAGKELIDIAPLQENVKYIEYIKEGFDKAGFNLKETSHEIVLYNLSDS